MSLCRICKGKLTEPLLILKNVPAAAQKMPASPEELAADLGVDLSLCQCLKCGVLQHTARPVPYFREVIRASGVSEEMRKFRLEQFSSWVKRYGLEGKKVFEAGCGRGEYLQLMAESGAAVCGTEFGESAVNSCRQRGLLVFKSYFETGCETVPEGPFDGFFILNFLEHIPDIPSFLEGIKNNLADGAAGIVEVPNFDMILENAQLTEFSTEHIFYFTESNLRSMLSNQGFEVISCKKIWYNYIISAEVIKRPPVDLTDCAAVERNLTADIRNFISQCGKTAFWGAGHQALTTLALCGLTSKEICFVVDSSPDKQGRCTFTTHIPITAPETLNDETVKGVIVACGGYSDEVAATVRSRYSKKLAILRENKLEIIQ